MFAITTSLAFASLERNVSDIMKTKCVKMKNVAFKTVQNIHNIVDTLENSDIVNLELL